MADKLGVAVVGCGLIGRRRALVAAQHEATRLIVACDVERAAAESVASLAGAAVAVDWRAAVDRPDVDIVVVSTPNWLLAEIALAGLGANKHVLIEKPMGRNLAEARQIAARATGRVLKVGFNHRYHRGIAEAWNRTRAGDVGPLINVRCRYGHGGRPGYEREWRGSRNQAGGGELTDQGVHVVDLIHWFLGVPAWAFGVLQTAVWPLGDLEDNGFGLFGFSDGPVAAFHTSWTQWKNLFSFEVTGRLGALVVEGLGRSYGTETLTWHRRRTEGGPPDTERWEFAGEDRSWELEWADFVGAVFEGRPALGTVDDGLVAMRMLDALYRSAAERRAVTLQD
jgi:predicted dehydrogenase